IQAFEWRSVRYTVGKNTRSRSCMTGLAGNHGGESPNRCTVNSRVARSAGVAGLKIYHTSGMISKSSIMTAGADRIRTQLGTDSAGEVQRVKCRVRLGCVTGPACAGTWFIPLGRNRRRNPYAVGMAGVRASSVGRVILISFECTTYVVCWLWGKHDIFRAVCMLRPVLDGRYVGHRCIVADITFNAVDRHMLVMSVGIQGRAAIMAIDTLVGCIENLVSS